MITCAFLQLPLCLAVRVENADNRSSATLRSESDTSTTTQPVMSTTAGNDTLQKIENFLALAMGNQSTSGIVGVAKNTEGDWVALLLRNLN